MLFKKKQDDERKDFEIIPTDTKLSILTLNKDWHDLFKKNKKNNNLRELEGKVNSLLKERGNLVNDLKAKKIYKKKLLKEIIILSQQAHQGDDVNNEIYRQIDEYKEDIQSANEELDIIEERIIDIPGELEQANKELFIESVKVCFKDMRKYKKDIQELDESINELKEQLADKVVAKQETEENLEKIYSLIHNIAGVDVMEYIDKNYGEKND